MANELKPCPFCGGTDLSPGGDDKFVGYSCKTCQATGPNHYGSRDWNTRPAAPVEGLAPVLYMREDGVTITPSHFDSIISPKANYAPLVTRSQAETIIAEATNDTLAAEAELRIVRNDLGKQMSIVRTTREDREIYRNRAEKAEADNEALTARVKEWSKSYAEKCVEYEEQKRRAEALETQLAATEKVREAAERVVWFDWSDNDDDAVKAVSDLRVALEDRP